VNEPTIQILDSVDSPIGVLELRRRKVPDDVITEILIGGQMLMSSLVTVSEEALSTAALALHPGDELTVLVGGLGLGYTAKAALADPRVKQLTVIDKMEAVIDWMRDGKLPLSESLAGDKRLEIVQGDVYAKLLGPVNERYDLILVDVDHAPFDPLDPASEPFYTWQGQRQVEEHLKPGGILGVWSAEDDLEFADVLCEVYEEARRELIRFSHPAVEDGVEIEECVFLARQEPFPDSAA